MSAQNFDTLTNKHTSIFISEHSLSQLSAMRYLPTSWGDSKGHSYQVIRASLDEVCQDSDLINNVSIQSHHDYADYGLGIFHMPNSAITPRTYIAMRQNKCVQSVLLNRCAKQLGLKHYIPVNTYRLKDRISVQRCKKYVLKPLNAARGIGQILFDGNSITGDGLIYTLHRIKETHTEEMSMTKHAEKLLSEALGKEVLFPTAREYSKDEGVNLLMDYPGVSEYIPDINTEFRLILNEASDGICYGLKRARVSFKNSELSQATGCQESMFDTVGDMRDLDIPRVIKSELIRFLKLLNAPLNALDLFITDYGKWGVMEISPEFGGVVVPADMITPAAKRFIEKISHL